MTEQWDRCADERRWWKELKEFADDRDVGGFYAHYAKYLEWNNMHSPQRQLLHKMALMASESVSDDCDEDKRPYAVQQQDAAIRSGFLYKALLARSEQIKNEEDGQE